MQSVQTRIVWIAFIIGLWACGESQAFEFFPSNEDILTYRKSWNPPSDGPILLTAVDINPKGQFHSQYFIFSEIGHQMFDNKLTTHRNDSSFHLTSVEPLLTLGYGLTDHLESDAAFTGLYFDSSHAAAPGNRTSIPAVGLGDTALYLKYRPVIQNPNSDFPPAIGPARGRSLEASLRWANCRPPVLGP
jgi:hypothetical protein